MFEQERAAIAGQIRQANEAIAACEAKIRDIDSELEGLHGQRQKFQLLNDVCQALDKLEEIGASQLFWGDEAGSASAQQRVTRARTESSHFLETIAEIEARRAGVQADIRHQEQIIDDCDYELSELYVTEQQKLAELFVEREVSKLPYHKMSMPWDPEGEDAKRSRKIIFLMLFFSIFIGTGMMFWKLPPVDKYKPIEVPKRVVQLAKNLPPPPPPKPVQKEEKKEEEKKEEKKPTEKPTPVEVQKAREVAQTKGVLQFSNELANMMDEDTPLQLGADANVKFQGSAGNSGGTGVGNGAAGSRSLIAAQGGAGSGGIANYGVSRGGVGSGSGSAIGGGGMTTARVGSAIGDMKGEERPLSKGAGPARTDEEIQIVFDKYKSSLYRLYNRELRNDPSLRGKVVLALTIEPDGRVSACKVQSSDLNAPQLLADIVDKVLKFNFGPKEGVPSTKILYPIDFLPSG